ncbi:UNVERIFIED_CONTAM: hypothetical protein GTU68_025695 [Idotea baltica]|nr:hypothetical protein [Idotea baltica]
MKYDIIIIGSGPGGYVTGIRASQLGFKVAIVEKEKLGGICLNWGCIPTKALLKSAQVYDYLKHVDAYGLKAKEIDKDFSAVIKRSRNVADGMSKGVQFLMKKNKIDVIEGFGKVKAGIKTNIENIGLEDVGIATDKDKIIVNDFYQTNLPGYYAIGDVVHGPALAHVASAEGITCVEKIGGLNPEAIDYGNVPGCTYATPEIASVGLTEAQAKEAGYELKIGKFPFSASGKAQASGNSEGFVKVIFDAKYGEWLGCHMIGAGVTDMIAEAVLGRKLETTGHEVLKAIHPHPTMSEAVMEAVADAYDEVIHL